MSNIASTSEVPDDPGISGHGTGQSVRPASFWILALGAIGVVYGDIGTSPLYALREAVKAGLHAMRSSRRPSLCSRRWKALTSPHPPSSPTLSGFRWRSSLRCLPCSPMARRRWQNSSALSRLSGS